MRKATTLCTLAAIAALTTAAPPLSVTAGADDFVGPPSPDCLNHGEGPSIARGCMVCTSLFNGGFIITECRNTLDWADGTREDWSDEFIDGFLPGLLY